MRIIAKNTLQEFWEKHPKSKEGLNFWHEEAKIAEWRSHADIKQRYCTASFLKDNRVCFNIKGNDYRLIVQVKYILQVVYIRFIGTHTEYEKIDANTV